MTLSEKISEEVRDLPDELNSEILDFILFVEQRRSAARKTVQQPEFDWDRVRIDTRCWRFDRGEANAR